LACLAWLGSGRRVLDSVHRSWDSPSPVRALDAIHTPELAFAPSVPGSPRNGPPIKVLAQLLLQARPALRMSDGGGSAVGTIDDKKSGNAELQADDDDDDDDDEDEYEEDVLNEKSGWERRLTKKGDNARIDEKKVDLLLLQRREAQHYGYKQEAVQIQNEIEDMGVVLLEDEEKWFVNASRVAEVSRKRKKRIGEVYHRSEWDTAPIEGKQLAKVKRLLKDRSRMYKQYRWDICHLIEKDLKNRSISWNDENTEWWVDQKLLAAKKKGIFYYSRRAGDKAKVDDKEKVKLLLRNRNELQHRGEADKVGKVDSLLSAMRIMVWDDEKVWFVQEEKRTDEKDGIAYTKKEFKDRHGDAWQQQWDTARFFPVPMNTKS